MEKASTSRHALGVVGATDSRSFDDGKADVLCAAIARGPVSPALAERVEAASGKLSFPDARERVLKALLRAKR